MNLLRVTLRISKWLLLAITLFTIAVSLFFVYPVIPDPESDYVPRKGQLLDSKVTRSWSRFGDEFEELTLNSDSGLQVEMSVRRPANPENLEKPKPLVMVIGGYGTGRTAIELIKSSQDLVIASINYPYEGDKRMTGWGLVQNIPSIQKAMLDITPAILLSLDYLLEQEYVDKNQVELVGVSLGAFFVATPAAIDKRFHRVWFVQGAGDPESIFEYRMPPSVESSWLRQFYAKLIALLGNVHHLTPERWVGRIAPRPVVAINSRLDKTFPIETVYELHNAMQEPREIIWLEGEHVKPSRPDIVKRLTDIVLVRVQQGIN